METIKSLTNQIGKLDLRIEVLAAKIEPLEQELSRYNEERGRLESLLFIRENNIELNDVQSRDAKECPWFGEIGAFGKWLKKNSVLPWCEWNGIIYRSKDIIEGKMPNSKGRYEDLK